MVAPKLDKNFYPMIKALEDFEKRVNAEKAENFVTETIRKEKPNTFCVIRVEHPYV